LENPFAEKPFAENPGIEKQTVLEKQKMGAFSFQNFQLVYGGRHQIGLKTGPTGLFLGSWACVSARISCKGTLRTGSNHPDGGRQSNSKSSSANTVKNTQESNTAGKQHHKAGSHHGRRKGQTPVATI